MKVTKTEIDGAGVRFEIKKDALVLATVIFWDDGRKYCNLPRIVGASEDLLRNVGVAVWLAGRIMMFDDPKQVEAGAGALMEENNGKEI